MGSAPRHAGIKRHIVVRGFWKKSPLQQDAPASLRGAFLRFFNGATYPGRSFGFRMTVFVT
jgi:hypothetical protein